jgi:hypothetical protein
MVNDFMLVKHQQIQEQYSDQVAKPIDDLMIIKNSKMCEAYSDGIKLEIAAQNECDYMIENGGYNMRYVTDPTCKHIAHVEILVNFDKREETCCMEIDRSLLK